MTPSLYFQVEEYRDLEILVKCHHTANLCTICVSLNSTDPPAAIFVPLIAWVRSSFTSLQRTNKNLYRVRWCITVVQGHSRSSKLVSIESPYVTDFLLVLKCNYMPIFYRFRDIATYWSKFVFFAVVIYLSLVWSLEMDLWDLGYESWSQNTGVIRLPGVGNYVIVRSSVLSH